MYVIDWASTIYCGVVIFAAAHIFRRRRYVKLQDKKANQAEAYDANTENRARFDRIQEYLRARVPMRASFHRPAPGMFCVRFDEQDMLRLIDAQEAAAPGPPIRDYSFNSQFDLSRLSAPTIVTTTAPPHVVRAQVEYVQEQLRNASQSFIGTNTVDAERIRDQYRANYTNFAEYFPSIHDEITIRVPPSAGTEFIRNKREEQGSQVQKILRDAGMYAGPKQVVSKPEDKILRRLKRVAQLEKDVETT